MNLNNIPSPAELREKAKKLELLATVVEVTGGAEILMDLVRSLADETPTPTATNGHKKTNRHRTVGCKADMVRWIDAAGSAGSTRATIQDNMPSIHDRYTVLAAFTRLANNGLIARRSDNPEFFVLTETGKEYAKMLAGDPNRKLVRILR